MPTWAKAGAASAEAKIKLAIHFVFIVFLPYNNRSQDVTLLRARGFGFLLPLTSCISGNPLVHVTYGCTSPRYAWL